MTVNMDHTGLGKTFPTRGIKQPSQAQAGIIFGLGKSIIRAQYGIYYTSSIY